jgi:hypothetical protein
MMSSPEQNAIQEIGLERNHIEILEDEKVEELRDLFKTIDYDHTGLIGVWKIPSLMKLAGFEISYDEAMEFLIADLKKSSGTLFSQEVKQISFDNLMRLTWWHLAEESRAAALNLAFRKLSSEDGIIGVRDALIAIDASYFRDSINTTLVKEVLIQHGVIKHEEINLRKLVRVLP